MTEITVKINEIERRKSVKKIRAGVFFVLFCFFVNQ
jgi:hypothetical protein